MKRLKRFSSLQGSVGPLLERIRSPRLPQFRKDPLQVASHQNRVEELDMEQLEAWSCLQEALKRRAWQVKGRGVSFAADHVVGLVGRAWIWWESTESTDSL